MSKDNDQDIHLTVVHGESIDEQVDEKQAVLDGYYNKYNSGPVCTCPLCAVLNKGKSDK